MLIAKLIWQGTFCSWRAFINALIHVAVKKISRVIQFGFDSSNRLLELVHAIARRSHNIISTFYKILFVADVGLKLFEL